MTAWKTIGWGALLSGVLAVLIVPLVVPVETSGTLTASEAAGPGATFVSLVDIDVHYEYEAYRGLAGDPPLMVLLHGFGASTYSWNAVQGSLAAYGDVVSYDRPAFGFTQRPVAVEGESPYGVPAQLDLIRAISAEFAKPGQEVILVGHSAGGTLAAEFALLFPGEVEALVLVAPAILSSGGGAGWLSFLTNIPQVDRIGPLLVGGIAESGNELLERSWHDVSALTPDIVSAYQQPLTVKGWERAFWEFSTTPREFTITDNPEGLSLPTAIITGDDDRVVATEDSVALSKVVVGSTLAVIPQSGHLPHEETPDAFMESFSKAWASFGFAFSP